MSILGAINRFRASLLVKFALLTVPVVVAGCAVFLWAYMDYRLDRHGAVLATDVAAVSVRTAQAIRVPLEKRDLKTARGLLYTLSGREEIICVDVMDSTGARFVSWPGLGCDKLPDPGVTYTRKIKKGPKTIGHFTVRYSDVPIRQQLQEDLWFILGALGFAGVSAFVIGILVQRVTVGRPLERLLRSVRHAQETGEREVVDWRSGDELGVVIDAYNHMTERQHARNAELEAANRSLTEEVEARLKTERELRQTQSQLVHASKMEALGTLAGGIAHEINTPIQYVGDNLKFMAEVSECVDKTTAAYRALAEAAESAGVLAAQVAAVREQETANDLEFMLEEFPESAEQALAGTAQVARIVSAMKEFAHPVSKHKVAVDLTKSIRSTVEVCRNEWKHAAELTLDLDETVPPVPGYPGELNQVILNLVVNAAQALKDVDRDGHIRIATSVAAEHAEVRIEDNGTGIPVAIRERIFDPFFTTKDVGEGTGQGLSIAHDIIAGKHGGELLLETEDGVGTTFTIRLPLRDPSEAADAADVRASEAALT